MSKEQTMQEYGHLYRIGYHDNFGQYWENTDQGNKVLVFPPNESRSILQKYWLVALPDQERMYPLIGEDVKERAFSVADLFIRQDSR